MKPRAFKPRLAFSTLALTVGLLAITAQGADLTWDTATGDGTTITNGTGTWQVGVANWNTAGADGNWVDGNNAIFGSGTAGTAGTVTLGGTISANKVIFNAPSAGLYTVDLNGNTLTTANVQGSVTVTGNTTATISDSSGGGSWNISNTGASFGTVDLTGNLNVSAKVTGTGRMFTFGGGNLTLTNNANDFTGLLGKQNGGVLSISSIAPSGVASAAGAGNEVILGFNAQLSYTGTAASTNRTLSLFGNNATINQNGSGALVWAGAVSNTMAANMMFTLSGSNNELNDLQGSLTDGGGVTNFTKNGAGTWQLSGNNSFTGTAALSEGTLITNHANALGSAVGSTSVTGNAQLILTGGIAIGAEALTLNSGAASTWNGQTGAALRSYSGINSFSGALTLGQSTTIATNSASMLTLTGGISGLQSLSFNSVGDTTVSTNGITTGAGTVTKAGAGQLTLSAPSTYTGATIIAAGTLQANRADLAAVSGALGNGGTISFTGGTLQYTANSATTDYSNRIINNTTAAIKIDTNGQNVTFGTALASSNTAGLTKEGAGQLELKMSAASQYTGTTTINGGTLKFASTLDLEGISSSNININHGASLMIVSNVVGSPNRTTLSNSKTFTFGNTGGGSIVYDKGNHLWQSSTGIFITTGGLQNTISSANGGIINPQVINTVNFNVADGTDAVDLLVSVPLDNGSYTKSGAGTLSLTSSSRLGGAGGVLGLLTISAGTFDVGGAAQLSTFDQSTGVVISNIVNNGVYRHSSSSAQTLSGVMSGSGALTQNGSGTLTLSGAHSYTGATTVTVGKLLINGDQSTATGAVSVSGSTMLGGSGTVGGATTINSTGVHSAGAVATGGADGIGKQSFSSSVTYDTGSIFEWNLAVTPAETGRGTSYDAVNAASLGSTTGAIFRVVLNGTQDFSSNFWDTDRTWSDIFKTGDVGSHLSIASIFTGTVQYYNGGGTTPTSLGTPTTQGAFTFSGSSLIWTAVPEPSSALAGLLLTAGLLRRRR